MIEILNVFGVDPKMMLAQAINFGIVLAVLWYFLYRPVVGMIEKRREDMIKAVADAERAANELKEADSKKKQVLTRANQEAESIVDNARQSAKEQETNIVQSANEKSEQMVREAQSQGEELKRQYIASSKEEIAKLVVLGIEKTIRKQS